MTYFIDGERHTIACSREPIDWPHLLGELIEVGLRAWGAPDFPPTRRGRRTAPKDGGRPASPVEGSPLATGHPSPPVAGANT